MEKSCQPRRQILAEGISRLRRSLQLMQMAEDKAPPPMKDQLVKRIQEMTDELGKMESEFHDLNVQQIREELSGK